MDYFEKSQAVKEEIKADSNLVSLIANHINGNAPLEKIGRGTMNVVYRVGQTDSGLWVALRENVVWGKKPEQYPAVACVYNSYCLEAERLPDAPAFCIGGTCNEKPFLLVEDVTEGDAYTPQHIGGGEKRVHLVKGNNIRTRAVDLGNDDPHHGVDDDTDFEIIMGTFDITRLKYFSLDARLRL
mgnify:CR=1 FL=1